MSWKLHEGVKHMAVIDLYADFIGGRSEYDVENLAALKREVAERLNRNDINWNLYNVLVNDEPVTDTHQFRDGDVVKVISPGIKGGQ
jgi:molybdopterin converting factor small subunit